VAYSTASSDRHGPRRRSLAPERIELLAQGRGSLNDERLQREHDLSSRFDRCVASNLEMPDHLDLARSGLRHRCASATQEGAGRDLGVKVISFALLVASRPIGSADLVDGMATLAQEQRHARPIRPCALDGKGTDGPE
jgi:hypothetical protein